MTVKVQDLMTSNVVTAEPHHTVGQIKGKMTKRNLSSVPVVSPDNVPIGVVSASDLLTAEKEGTPISSIVTGKVCTIPGYEEVSVAARDA